MDERKWRTTRGTASLRRCAHARIPDHVSASTTERELTTVPTDIEAGTAGKVILTVPLDRWMV